MPTLYVRALARECAYVNQHVSMITQGFKLNLEKIDKGCVHAKNLGSKEFRRWPLHEHYSIFVVREVVLGRENRLNSGFSRMLPSWFQFVMKKLKYLHNVVT